MLAAVLTPRPSCYIPGLSTGFFFFVPSPSPRSRGRSFLSIPLSPLFLIRLSRAGLSRFFLAVTVRRHRLAISPRLIHFWDNALSGVDVLTLFFFLVLLSLVFFPPPPFLPGLLLFCVCSKRLFNHHP